MCQVPFVFRPSSWLFALFFGCATAPTVSENPRALRRKDWVLTWDREVERTSVFAGRSIKVIGPAEAAVRQVRLRSDIEEEERAGKRPAALGMIGGMSPPVFDPRTPIEVKAGEIQEWQILGEPFRVIEHASHHARVYWTIGRQGVRSSTSGAQRFVFSTVFVEGLSEGEDALVLLPLEGVEIRSAIRVKK